MVVLRSISSKLLFAVPVLILVTLGTTALIDLMPGSPAVTILGQTATPEQIAAINAEYGFDDPFWERYWSWLVAALQGNLGTSLLNGRSVTADILQRIPVTAELALLAMIISLVISVPLGVIAAAKVASRLDRMLSGIASASMALPSFVVAVLLVFFLSVINRVFPVTGWVPFAEDPIRNLYYAFLPALALAVAEFGFFYRLLRGDMVATLQQDFVLSARAKGLSRKYVLFRHALRPSLFSLITMAGLSFGRMLGGAVIVEFFFAIPGLGNLMLVAIPYTDIPTIQGVVVFIAVVFVLINITVDALLTAVDPRVRGK